MPAAEPGAPYPGYPPPSYSQHPPSSLGTDGASDEPLPKDEDKRPSWFVRRGGWRRMALYILLAVACVVGLSVGLTLGLRKRA
jgi:hypothetical protein